MTIQHYSEKPFELFTMDGLFTNEECLKWLSDIQNTSFEHTRPFTQSNFNNGKVINPETSQFIFHRIAPHLPSNFHTRVVKYIFFSHIKAGQEFGIHTDTGSEYDIKNNEKSAYTVLIYLNDDFKGGTTQFYTKNLIPTAEIHPKKGRVLMFNIDLFHQGKLVVEGDKYWIGTEWIGPICK